jgi:6-phosphogluconolactonase
VDRSGKNVLVANYSAGTVAVLPIAEDGSLKEATGFQKHEGHSVNPNRQREPHAHSINLSPDNRFAIAADLGLDKLLVYRFDAAKGTLEPNNPPSVSITPGSGPRHFAFHPNGMYAYAINEMKSTVTAFDWDAKRGVLTEKQTVSTLPSDFAGESSTAEVVVHPNGKFLYGSNRGHDSIAVFSIAADGRLSPVEITPAKVKIPRNFAIDPSGEYFFAAGQNSNNIVVFRVDGKTGKLTETNLALQVGSPVCVRFAPAK